MVLKLLNDGLSRLLASVAVAVALLVVYNGIKVDAENAALGTENHAAFETWNGRRITAPRPREIADLITDAQTAEATAQLRSPTVVWLGNSQLHTINQYKAGEHLAPYWLAANDSCSGCVLPLGISLPNANIQEHLIIALHAVKRLNIRLVTIKLVFDDLREDGVRDELSLLFTEDVRAELGLSDVGREMIGAFEKRRTETGSIENKPDALAGFAQQKLEEALDTRLSQVFPLWAERGNLRGRLLLDLYHIRNWAFGITPSSVRRMIPARYSRNMRAFDELVLSMRRAGVPLLAYIAPIRADVPIPYDLGAYRRWIEVLALNAQRDGFAFVDLGAIVPGDQWGTYSADQVDFMHFQGSGHKLLAAALWPHMQRALGGSGTVKPAAGGSGAR